MLSFPSALSDEDGLPDKGTDQLPYTTLIYANGPGGQDVMDSYQMLGNRPNLTNTDTSKSNGKRAFIFSKRPGRFCVFVSSVDKAVLIMQDFWYLCWSLNPHLDYNIISSIQMLAL